MGSRLAALTTRVAPPPSSAAITAVTCSRPVYRTKA